HRGRASANTEQEAIETVREALASHGAFGDFHAALVRDSRGEVVLTPMRSWTDIDWEEVQRKAPLTELQRNVLSPPRAPRADVDRGPRSRRAGRAAAPSQIRTQRARAARGSCRRGWCPTTVRLRRELEARTSPSRWGSAPAAHIRRHRWPS